MKDWMTIGQFAKRVGLTPRMLRLYERQRLIQPKKGNDNQYRYYTPEMLKPALQIRRFRQLGFSIREIQGLLAKDPNLDASQILESLQGRLNAIRSQQKDLRAHESELQSLIASLKKQNKELKPSERRLIMNSIQTASVLICGYGDLALVAEAILSQTRASGVPIRLYQWSKDLVVPSDEAHILLVQEDDLDDFHLGNLLPQAVIVQEMSAATADVREKYLRLFANVGPAQTTILNADDRASIELARIPQVQKGRIYYFSKNQALRDQIQKIGGVFSDGEAVQIFGFHQKPQIYKYPIERPLAHRQELALMIALTSLIDFDLSIPLVEMSQP